MRPLAGSLILQNLPRRVGSWYAGSRLGRTAAAVRRSAAGSLFLGSRPPGGANSSPCWDYRTAAGSSCVRTIAATLARWNRTIHSLQAASVLVSGAAPHRLATLLAGAAILASAALLIGPYRAVLFCLVLGLSWASWRDTSVGLLLLLGLVLIKWQLKQWLPGAASWLTLAPPLLLLLTFAGWFSRARWREERPPAMLPVDKGLVLLLGSIVLSNVNSLFIYHRPANLLYDSLVWIQAAGVYLTARAGLSSTRQVRLVLAGFLILALVVAGVGLHQAWTGFKTPGTWIESYDQGIRTRIISTVGNPNGLGGFLNVALLLAGALFLFQPGRARPVLLLCGIPMATALLYTYSRGAWLGCAAGALMLCLWYHRRAWLIFLTLALAVLLLAPPAAVDRLMNIFNPAHLSSSETAGRLWSLYNVMYILPRHLWLGVGLGMYGGTTAYTMFSPVYNEGLWAGYVAVPYVDNLFLHVLIQQGLLGFAAFSVFVVTVLTTFRRMFRGAGTPLARGLAAGSGAAWVAYLVQGLAATSTEFPQMTVPVWLLLGLTAAAYRHSGPGDGAVSCGGEAKSLGH